MVLSRDVVQKSGPGSWHVLGKTSCFPALCVNILKTVRDTIKVTTNGKLHISFRLAPRSMTLDDLERLKVYKFSPNFALSNFKRIR